MLKRILAFTGTILLGVSLLTTAAAVGYGDCNRDGSVDIRDLVRAKKYAVQTVDRDVSVAAIDYNRSGAIEAEDLTKLRRVLLGVETYEDMTPSGSMLWSDNWDASLGYDD